MRRQQFGMMVAACSVLAVLSAPVIVHAQQSQSSNYQVNEVYFGPGGNLNASSPNYQGQQSVESTAGNTAGSSYQGQAGFNTTDFPVLEVTVNGGLFDLGILGIGAPKSTSASFSVRNYLSSGYVVQIAGDTLRQAGNPSTVINAMSTAATSAPGTQQFGLNLKQNTTPVIGAEAQQQPDSTFSYGAAAPGYDTVNQYKFVPGDTIAASSKSSGKTLYTMSFIANISANTSAGLYGTTLSVVVTPTF